MTTPTVSIAIASLNRRDDLRQTLFELRNLDPAPLEVLVCLDGCTDGSEEMVQEFSWVRVIRHEIPQGSIASRDELFRLAEGDLIVSLDDDSYPTQNDFVARVIKLSIDHPEAGAFAFKELRVEGRDDRLFQPPGERSYVASYPNCAGVIRKTLYARSARYPAFFIHMYEEPDFCLQTYASGFAVMFDPTIHVLHRYTHVGRNLARRHRQHARNEFWSTVMRCPMPHVLWLAPYRVARQFIYAASHGWKWASGEPLWWWSAAVGLPKALASRKPVSWRVYWTWISLGRKPATSLSELRSRLTGVRFPDGSRL